MRDGNVMKKKKKQNKTKQNQKKKKVYGCERENS